MQKISKTIITDELLQKTMLTNEKIYVDDFTNLDIAKLIDLDITKPIKQTLRGDKIAHTIKRHGKDSNLVIHNDEVRVLTPNGRSYAPRINLSVELDSSSRASVDNTTTKTTKSKCMIHYQM